MANVSIITNNDHGSSYIASCIRSSSKSSLRCKRKNIVIYSIVNFKPSLIMWKLKEPFCYFSLWVKTKPWFVSYDLYSPLRTDIENDSVTSSDSLLIDKKFYFVSVISRIYFRIMMVFSLTQNCNWESASFSPWNFDLLIIALLYFSVASTYKILCC